MDQENNKSKKIVCLILFLILLSIIVFCVGMLVGKIITGKKAKTGNNKTVNTVNNQPYSNKDLKITQFDTYHIATYEGIDYYVIDDDYKGEYYIETLDLFEDIQGRTEKTDEELREFKVEEVMDYSTYAAYCERWNLEKKYNNEEMNYIVYAYYENGAPSYEARLAEVEYSSNTARLYVWSRGGGEVDTCAAFVIVVPTNEDVEKVEWQYLYTTSSLDNYLYNKSIENKNRQFITVDEKPIIYLYPEKETNVSVELGYSDKITCSYPKYNDGWDVLAKPDGDLIDLKTNKDLYALYYESEAVIDFNITSEGFIVKGEDVSEFLEEKLAILGLTEREAEEFIVYWLPRLEQNKYNYIRFATEEEINNNMPLAIKPKPDSLIRIMMVFKGLDEPIEVLEQELQTPERIGFVAVEWGGTEIK